MRVRKSKEETAEDEIRLSNKGFVQSYMAYGARQLLEKKLGAIKLKASGQAISKVCYVADVLRRRIKGLHM